MKKEIFKLLPNRRSKSFSIFFRSHISSFPRVSLAVPYWNSATYRAILNCLTSGEIIDGPELEGLRVSLVETLGVVGAVLCGSGSLALEIALRALGVPRGDEVVIPTFCCTAVVSPILAVGAVPVLADAGAELNMTAETVEAVLSAKTKAIIVPHLFGNPAEIRGILDLARGKNIFVIDDAAQALGATIDGRTVSCFGDAGIISFGREKVCFGLGGGAVVLGNHDVAAAVANLRLSPPAAGTALSNLISTLVWCRWRRWSQPLERVLSLTQRNGPEKSLTAYPKNAMANLDAAVVCSLMGTLRENVSARRARVVAYQELLGGEERLRLIPHRDGSACLTQVVRIPPLRRSHDTAALIVEELCKTGYEVQGSYVPIHLLPGHERCKWRRLPHAEKVWADLLELPCEPEVKLDDIERMAQIIKQLLRA